MLYVFIFQTAEIISIISPNIVRGMMSLLDYSKKRKFHRRKKNMNEIYKVSPEKSGRKYFHQPNSFYKLSSAKLSGEICEREKIF